MKRLGERIRKRRLELGITQRVLRQKSKLSAAFMSDVENGKRGISAVNLLAISRALGVSMDFLMTGKRDD